MNVKFAIKCAKEYVMEMSTKRKDLVGAYLSGSILTMNLSDELNPWSDVDVMLVVSPYNDENKPGKAIYNNVLIEGSLLDSEILTNREQILSTHYIGYALSHDSILYDPHGIIQNAQNTIKDEYMKPFWVGKRIDNMLSQINGRILGFDPNSPLPQRVTSYFFTLGISVYPFLLGAGENLTVRKRYSAARHTMEKYGLRELYDRLLLLLTGGISKGKLLEHMKELEVTFDLASKSHGKSDLYNFRSDISADSRRVSIDGTYEIINSNYPQEAVFWMGATFARCHTVLMMDGNESRVEQLMAFLSDLGINDNSDIQERFEELSQLLPIIEEKTKAMINI